MENSPKLRVKTSSRLSFRRKHRLSSDSPKTPIRKLPRDSGDTPTAVNMRDTSCTTPLNYGKRAYFNEESPSQDYDGSHFTMLLSQDPNRCDIDVGWKWDVPATKKKEIPKQFSEKLFTKRLRSPKRQTRKAIKPTESVQKKGFYKFREELLFGLNSIDSESKDVENLTLPNDELNDHLFEEANLNSSCKENQTPLISEINSLVEVSKIEQKNSHVMEKHKPVTAKTESMDTDDSGNKFLDDSDLDNLLLQCSQQVEDKYKSSTPKAKSKQHEELKKTELAEQDSIDEFLMTFPIEEEILLTQKCDKINSETSPSSINSIYQNRNAFIRHHSMPVSPQTNIIRKRPSSTLVRHSSMPGDQQQNLQTHAGSTESVSSDFEKKCTADEIKRKRIEALQRLEASKKRNKQCGNNLTHFKRNINTSQHIKR